MKHVYTEIYDRFDSRRKLRENSKREGGEEKKINCKEKTNEGKERAESETDEETRIGRQKDKTMMEKKKN